MARKSQKIAVIILIPYVVCGIALCVLLLDRKYCDSVYYYYPAGDDTLNATDKDETKSEEAGMLVRSKGNRFCSGGNHGELSMLATLLVGFTIIIYRILIGKRTRVVKYIHMGLHTVSLVLFSIGIWCIFTHEYSMIYNHIYFHGITSWFTFTLFCIQFVVATIVYSYQYPNTKLRLYLAPIHDIVGIWIFLCCVACCISGRTQAQLDFVGHNQELFFGLTYICFTCILIVILSPYYEWDVIGPL